MVARHMTFKEMFGPKSFHSLLKLLESGSKPTREAQYNIGYNVASNLLFLVEKKNIYKYMS